MFMELNDSLYNNYRKAGEILKTVKEESKN